MRKEHDWPGIRADMAVKGQGAEAAFCGVGRELSPYVGNPGFAFMERFFHPKKNHNYSI